MIHPRERKKSSCLQKKENMNDSALLHNISCVAPHTDGRVYTYKITESFEAFSICMAVLNIIAAVPTVFFNLAIILGFIQQKGLRTTSNRLLFSICSADLLTGLMVEPVLGAHMIQISKASHECNLSNFLMYIFPVLLIITMVTHSIVALERYCSVYHVGTYNKSFTKRNITMIMVFIWLIGSAIFIIPYLSGNAVLGTKIMVVTILLSLAVCSFCYISLYQAHAWKDGRPTAKIKGPHIIGGVKRKERSAEEQEVFQQNLLLSSFYSKIFLCMLLIYALHLTKNVLNAYGLFPGNTRYIVHFTFDTLLCFHALINPLLVMYMSREITKAAIMVFRS